MPSCCGDTDRRRPCLSRRLPARCPHLGLAAVVTLPCSSAFPFFSCYSRRAWRSGRVGGCRRLPINRFLQEKTITGVRDTGLGVHSRACVCIMRAAGYCSCAVTTIHSCHVLSIYNLQHKTAMPQKCAVNHGLYIRVICTRPPRRVDSWGAVTCSAPWSRVDVDCRWPWRARGAAGRWHWRLYLCPPRLSGVGGARLCPS